MTLETFPVPNGPDPVTEEFGAGNRVAHFLDVALRTRAYDRNVALEFVAAGKGQSGESWAERSLALLFLENQMLRLALDELDEFDVILVGLGMKPMPGADVPMRASILGEGYTTLTLRGFANELIRRLRRLNRIHEPILQGACDQLAWENFLRVAREAPKLTLGRYAFTAEEVFREVVRRLRVSKGVEDTLSRFGEQPAAHWTRDPLDIPDFEAEIVKKLCADHNIYWLSEHCGSELNSLVEYPLTSAVVVVKPPGSDLEIEFKRAGAQGRRLLNVITERNGRDAPTSHRLFGGSLGWLAQREAAAVGIFSRIYELVHGVTAPCSRSVLNTSIVTVPTANGETHLLDYLTDESCFGDGFDRTREAMSVCVEAFPSDTGVARAGYGGARGLTLQFVGQALPLQAVIVGSSSFRLDRILLYLSNPGPEAYFRTGLGRDFTELDARWLADTVLEEILGEVIVPAESDGDYAQYVHDAFHVAGNRQRADENFLSVMRQIGECWGTLLAVRGFSDGESFVLRNVGLKSVWQDGAWQIRTIFMDHDDLTVAGSRYQHLWPWREASGMERDLIHILGGPMGDDVIPGEVGVLKSIYRVTPDVGEAGLKSLEEMATAAYRKTQSELATNQELRGLFNPRFLAGYRDFDQLLPAFLQTDPSDKDSWKAWAEAILREKRYEDDLIAEYTKTVSHFRSFFERISFLYSR